jgi:hypothetical protein
MSSEAENVVRLESAQETLRRHFLGWQCRIRQRAVRQDGGRPCEGMRPMVTPGEARITVLIVGADPRDDTAQLRHLARKTHDPAERLDAALRTLSATHYQHPDSFSDRITALFGPGSDLPERLLDDGRCRLDFQQYNQHYRIPCAAGELAENDPAWQATFWHNTMFNPNIPAGIRILAFTPDWAAAEADPPAL